MSVTIEKQSCFAEGPFWNRNIDKPPEKKGQKCVMKEKKDTHAYLETTD